nr:hypothetical protein [Tanacetum cinerariifolium]
PPRFRATIKDISVEPSSIAKNKTEKILLLTWYESSEPAKKLVYDSITPSSLPQHDSSTPCKVIGDVMRQLSFEETKVDGEAGFVDVARSGVESSRLSHDESFVVDDLDFNLNEPVNLNVSQIETQSELLVSEELDVGRTHELILAEEFIMEDVVLKDYVSSREDAKECNGQEYESAPSEGQFFYDDKGIDIAYETEYVVQSSKDACIDDDDDGDEEEYFLVHKENKIVEPNVDVHFFGISMDLLFDNFGVTNLVPNDVLEGADVDVINPDGLNSDSGNDDEINDHKKSRLAELSREMKGVINSSGQWKYVFYTGQKFTTLKEAKDRVCLYFIESRRNLKQYKNHNVRIRARCDEKVPVFTTLQGTRPTDPNRGMKVGPSRSSGPSTRSKKGRIQIFDQDMVNPDIPVKAVEDQLQRELEVQISMSKAFIAKAKAKREFSGDHCLGDDIDMHPNSNFTFISDRQKGIIPAIKTVFLNVEHIYCLQHIHEIIKQGWCVQAYKYLLWRAASATSVKEFEKYMLELKTKNPKAHERLNKIPPEHWAISYFSGRAKFDVLLNNICEVFNGKIVDDRDKLVITLLEYIRKYCMKRIMNVQNVIEKCNGPLTPTITRIIESIKKEAHLMKVQWNGANTYQVSGLLGDQCVVDVVTMTYSCRK